MRKHRRQGVEERVGRLAAVAAKCAEAVTFAETPLRYSKRDGKLLRLVPRHERLSRQELEQHLAAALDADPVLFQHAASACQQQLTRKSGAPPRQVAAWLRGVAYLQAGNTAQALLDAQTALAYAPKLPPELGGHCSWPPGLILMARVQAAGGEGAKAAVAYQQALEALTSTTNTMSTSSSSQEQLTQQRSGPSITSSRNISQRGGPNTTAPGAPVAPDAAAAEEMRRAAGSSSSSSDGCAEYLVSKLQQLREQSLTPAQAAAVAAGGSKGLLQQLQEEHEASLPEFLRSKPKWHYYNTWMARRIAVEAPELTRPILDKLLQIDAGDLDLLLQHPLALHAQIHELQLVLEDKGPEGLTQHRPELLSWEEVQALSGQALVGGLGLGYSSPKPLQQAQRRVLALLREQPALLTGGTGEAAGRGGSSKPLQQLQQQRKTRGDQQEGEVTQGDRQQQQQQNGVVLPSQDSLDTAMASSFLGLAQALAASSEGREGGSSSQAAAAAAAATAAVEGSRVAGKSTSSTTCSRKGGPCSRGSKTGAGEGPPGVPADVAAGAGKAGAEVLRLASGSAGGRGGGAQQGVVAACGLEPSAALGVRSRKEYILHCSRLLREQLSTA